MRILMASDYFYPFLLGGGERQMYEIAKRLARKHEIHIITRRLGDLSSYELVEGIHIHRVFVPSKDVTLESPLNGSFFMLSSWIESLRLGDFDVYAPQQFFPIPPLWLSQKIRGKPIVATIHDVYRDMWVRRDGFRAQLMSVFERILLKLHYSRIITVSNSTKEKLTSSGIPSQKIDVIYNGINVGEYDKVKAKKSPKPRIIFTGRLVGYKNVDDLIRAFSKLSTEAELYIVGEGPERGKLQRLSRKLGIQDKVTFTGFISEEEKIKLLKSSHALVLPSSTEGFGISVIEAMAAKTPVIVSNISALKEVVGDGEVGLVFELKNAEDLTDKLDHLLSDKNMQRKLSQKGYKLVREKFNWDKIASNVEKILQTCQKTS